MNKQLTAIEPLMCNRVDYAPGDDFEASAEDAHTLITLGRAKLRYASKDMKSEDADADGKKRGRYTRRDMQAQS